MGGNCDHVNKSTIFVLRGFIDYSRVILFERKKNASIDERLRLRRLNKDYFNQNSTRSSKNRWTNWCRRTAFDALCWETTKSSSERVELVVKVHKNLWPGQRKRLAKHLETLRYFAVLILVWQRFFCVDATVTIAIHVTLSLLSWAVFQFGHRYVVKTTELENL